MSERNDADLPGDATFRPVTSGTRVEGGMILNVMPHDPAYQAIVHHNQLRYAELGKLRAGQPNRYNETSYRS